MAGKPGAGEPANEDVAVGSTGMEATVVSTGLKLTADVAIAAW